MDNYFNECPARMSDGRMFTDYRSSQVREEVFRHRTCTVSENEARTLRIDRGKEFSDDEWKNIKARTFCIPNKDCFHKQPTTRVTTKYNNAELLAYNGVLGAPQCDIECPDYRATYTDTCPPTVPTNPEYAGYPADRCPVRCQRTDRLLPDNLYVIDGKY